MGTAQMRQDVIFAYAGKHKGTPWENKVNNMSDAQVQSIYFRLKSTGKLK